MRYLTALLLLVGAVLQLLLGALTYLSADYEKMAAENKRAEDGDLSAFLKDQDIPAADRARMKRVVGADPEAAARRARATGIATAASALVAIAATVLVLARRARRTGLVLAALALLAAGALLAVAGWSPLGAIATGAFALGLPAALLAGKRAAPPASAPAPPAASA
jgi:hypothetical protein